MDAIRNPKFTMKEDAKIDCRACGAILRPVYEFVSAHIEEFRKALGQEPKVSDKFVCINCGLIYESDFTNTGNVIEWLEAIKAYYKS